MAYMTPQQWRDALIGIGQGKRFTAYEDPNEADPRDVLKFTGSALDRGGAPNLAASRGPTYNPTPIEQTPVETVRNFGQQQQGVVADVDSPPLPFAVEGFVPPGRAGLSGRVAAGGLGDDLMSMDTTYLQPGQDQDVDITGPRSMMSKIGGFFNRPGAARDIGAALTSLGAGLGAESSRPGGSAWAGLASGANLATQSLARSREEELRRQMIEQQQQAARNRDELAEKNYLLNKKRFDSEQARRDAEDQIEQDQRDADKLITDNLQELYDAAGVEGLSPEEARTRTLSATRQALNIATINQNVGLAQVLEQRVERLTPAGEKMELTWSTAYDPSGNMKRVGIDPATGISYVNEGGRITSINLDDWSTSAPDKEQAEQASALERMNTRLGRAGGRAAAGLVADNQDLSLTGAVPPTRAQVAQALGFAAGAGVNQEEYDAFIKNPENIDYWRDPEASLQASPEQRVALAKAIAAQIVGDPNGMSNQGFIKTTFMAGLRASDWVTDEAQAAYVNSLNFINPVVRFLSGAQMTNQEALRYYSALVPMPGEPVSVTRLKRERRNVLLNAMGLDAATGEALAADDPAVIQALNTMGMNPANGPLQDMNELGLSEDQRRIQGNRARDAYLAALESAIPIEAGLAYKIEDYDESAGYEAL